MLCLKNYVWPWASPLYGKKRQLGAMATSDSGSVFFPPGVCRMKFRRGMLGMWQWLYVQSQTINQKSLSSLKWKQCPDPRWQFCFAGLCEQCVATGYPSASSWQGSEDGECHCNSTKKRKQVSAGGNVIFMTPKLSPPGTRIEKCTMRFQWVDGNWSLELLSCPILPSAPSIHALS